MKTHSGNIVRPAPALAALGLTLATIPQVKGAGFVSVSPMNNGRNYHTATLLQDGKVLVAGGAQAQSVTSAELYDPATDTWTMTGSLRAGRTFHTATLLLNGKVLVAGGDSAGTSTELYDPASGTWTTTGPMSFSGTTATLLPNGKVLVAGYWGSEIYDPATGTWTATGSTNTAHTKHTATLLLNGKVLVAAGHRVSTAELYDPDNGTWLLTGALTSDRVSATATLLSNGQVLIAGGYNNVTDRVIPNAVYDPTTGTWKQTPMSGRETHTATLLPNGKVLIAGGLVGLTGSDVTSTAQLYVPDSDGAGPSITMLRHSDQIMSFSWNGPGTLEQSDSLSESEWQPAPIQDNPCIVSTANGPMKFFRLRFNQ